MPRVAKEAEFRAHVGRIESTDRYVRFLRDVAETTGHDITPQSLATEEDVERFAAGLRAKYADKSIANYRSVMRKYVEMVRETGQ